MKVDFSTVILDLDDKPVRETAQPDSAAATLGFVARMALQHSGNPQNPDPPERKLRCFDLMLLVHKGGVLDITPEQATLLKEKIGAMFDPLVYGRSVGLLNG